MAILIVVAVLAVVLLLAFFRASIWSWLVAISVIVPVVAISNRISGDALWIIFIALGVFVLVIGVPILRRLLVSSFILSIFRKILPQISATEQEAIDAGTVWWDGELFSGNPNWNKLRAFPKPSLSSTEQAFLDNEVEQLCAMLDDWDITHQRADLPPEVWQFIKDKGFFGMIIPKRYGGLEFSAQAHSAVVSK
ncbi:MAG: acyl-CoA dehydrogenase family protein, partial [Gallionella sp.]